MKYRLFIFSFFGVLLIMRLLLFLLISQHLASSDAKAQFETSGFPVSLVLSSYIADINSQNEEDDFDPLVHALISISEDFEKYIGPTIDLFSDDDVECISCKVNLFILFENLRI